jgi:hypothetical protein
LSCQRGAFDPDMRRALRRPKTRSARRSPSKSPASRNRRLASPANSKFRVIRGRGVAERCAISADETPIHRTATTISPRGNPSGGGLRRDSYPDLRPAQNPRRFEARVDFAVATAARPPVPRLQPQSINLPGHRRAGTKNAVAGTGPPLFLLTPEATSAMKGPFDLRWFTLGTRHLTTAFGRPLWSAWPTRRPATGLPEVDTYRSAARDAIGGTRFLWSRYRALHGAALVVAHPTHAREALSRTGPPIHAVLTPDPGGAPDESRARTRGLGQ